MSKKKQSLDKSLKTRNKYSRADVSGNDLRNFTASSPENATAFCCNMRGKWSLWNGGRNIEVKGGRTKMTEIRKRCTYFIEEDETKTRFWLPGERPTHKKPLPPPTLWSLSNVIFEHISRIISSSCNKNMMISRKNKPAVRIWGFGKCIHIRAFLYILIIYSNMVTRKSDFNIGLLENISHKKFLLYTIFFDTPCLLGNAIKVLIQSIPSLSRIIKMDYSEHYFCLNFYNLERNMS
jgi:hypothetical protein